MEAPKPAMTTASQPQAVQMSVMNPPARQSTQHTEECQHKRGLAARLRGGGAARDCFLGAIECFLCFECCKVSLYLYCMLGSFPTPNPRTAASVPPTSSAARARCAVNSLRRRPGRAMLCGHEPHGAPYYMHRLSKALCFGPCIIDEAPRAGVCSVHLTDGLICFHDHEALESGEAGVTHVRHIQRASQVVEAFEA
ncbi:hypothetical protein PYCCODRAFT_1185512 [Trametes coccinea BRFM310]|uniref:Uncharacterized protein n=1 Tax=Trametes coccinea (strain BRFM310) TaxID=1353009 RepID=A0A1Y2IA03_TRAC3|nr:hypothetical protein PYCCODRAFT_1185512 [Trametes coccinea BRFM310]